MSHYRRIRVRTSTHQSISLRSSASPSYDGFCDGCGAVTHWLHLEHAADLAEITAREIFRRVESGEIHSRDTEARRTVICRSSLMNYLKKEK
jgi:hypothetical protein